MFVYITSREIKFFYKDIWTLEYLNRIRPSTPTVRIDYPRTVEGYKEFIKTKGKRKQGKDFHWDDIDTIFRLSYLRVIGNSTNQNNSIPICSEPYLTNIQEITHCTNHNYKLN